MSKIGRLRNALLQLIGEHQNDGTLPTSPRFLFYELVLRGVISKPRQPGGSGRRPDQDMNDALTDLRESGRIPWDWIVDKSRSIRYHLSYSSIREGLKAKLPYVRLDPWRATAHTMNESEQFGECRHPDAERLSGTSPIRPLDSVESPLIVYFDWEIPKLATPRLLTFLARVRCGARERSFRVPINVARKTEGRTADLEKLHNILATRHAGLDDRSSLLEALQWMLNISLEQTDPELSFSERQNKVRELLFVSGGQPNERTPPK
jgi:hypothetical protein